MRIQVQLTEQDYVASRWLAMRPRRGLRVVGWIAVSVLLFRIAVGINEVLHHQSDLVEMWCEIGAIVYGGIVFWVLRPWLLKRKMQKIFWQQKSLQRPFELEFTDSHLSGVAENGHATIAWTDFV